MRLGIGSRDDEERSAVDIQRAERRHDWTPKFWKALSDWMEDEADDGVGSPQSSRYASGYDDDEELTFAARPRAEQDEGDKPVTDAARKSRRESAPEHEDPLRDGDEDDDSAAGRAPRAALRGWGFSALRSGDDDSTCRGRREASASRSARRPEAPGRDDEEDDD